MAALTTSRDALAKAIWEASRADEGTISATGANHVADRLLASGAVVDVDALVDDEALVEQVRDKHADLVSAFREQHGHDKPWSFVRGTLRALTAALTERGQA